VIPEASRMNTAVFMAISLVIALAAGLIISSAIYKIGKKNNANYDWRILWLSVSIIAFVIEVLYRAWHSF